MNLFQSFVGGAPESPMWARLLAWPVLVLVALFAGRRSG